MLINFCFPWNRINAATDHIVSTLCFGAGDMFGDTLQGDWCPPQTTSAQGSPSHILQVTIEAHSE